jgi:hypothetical protein
MIIVSGPARTRHMVRGPNANELNVAVDEVLDVRCGQLTTAAES